MDSLRGYLLSELEEKVLAEGFPKFRAKQVTDFLYQTTHHDWEDSNNLPRDLIELLKKDHVFCSLRTVQTIPSVNDKTTKYLHETSDGFQTESVIIRKNDRITACLSSQVGCKFACRFCISGSKGLFRNLTTSEIVDQFFLMQQDQGERITNLVMMGMGEPFDNYEAVMKALRILNAKWAFELGARHITVSTVGVPEGIEKFSKEGLGQMKLALSLHAPNDELRYKIMPVNRKYDIATIMRTLKKCSSDFKRKITFEYILFGDLNDSVDEAKQLAKLAKEIDAKVNLIQYNPTGFGIDETPFKKTTLPRLRAFRQELDKWKVVNTLRKSGGSDVGAACGQLALDKK